MTLEADKRHPFRFMIKLVVFFGIVYALGRFVAEKKNEFSGLTESQAREKLVSKIGPKVGEETAAEIADNVIPKLKEKGLVTPDPDGEPSSEQAAKDKG